MFFSTCGKERESGSFQQSYRSQQKEPSMKWYQFLICFLLFAHAAFSIIGAVGYFSGATTSALAEGKVSAQWIYAMYPALRGFMYGMGILCLILAVLAVIVRQWLVHFDKKGIFALAAWYLANLASNIIYIAGLLGIVGIRPGVIDSVTISCTAISAIGSIALFLLNRVYFKKRAHLFY